MAYKSCHLIWTSEDSLSDRWYKPILLLMRNLYFTLQVTIDDLFSLHFVDEIIFQIILERVKLREMELEKENFSSGTFWKWRHILLILIKQVYSLFIPRTFIVFYTHEVPSSQQNLWFSNFASWHLSSSGFHIPFTWRQTANGSTEYAKICGFARKMSVNIWREHERIVLQAIIKQLFFPRGL